MWKKVKKWVESPKAWVVVLGLGSAIELLISMHNEQGLPDYSISTYVTYLEFIIWMAALFIMSHKRCK